MNFGYVMLVLIYPVKSFNRCCFCFFFVAFLLRHLVFFAKKKIVTNSKSTKTVREDRLHRLDVIFSNENLQVAP